MEFELESGIVRSISAVSSKPPYRHPSTSGEAAKAPSTT